MGADCALISYMYSMRQGPEFGCLSESGSPSPSPSPSPSTSSSPSSSPSSLPHGAVEETGACAGAIQVAVSELGGCRTGTQGRPCRPGVGIESSIDGSLQRAEGIFAFPVTGCLGPRGRRGFPLLLEGSGTTLLETSRSTWHSWTCNIEFASLAFQLLKQRWIRTN